MPLSSNAPFNEFGHSMILRHLEHLDMTLGGAGSGSAGEGQTQDQSTAVTQTSGDSGGLPDLSGLATIDYVDQQDNDIYEYVDNAIAAIPSISYPISIANGGTGQTNYGSALSALGALFTQTNVQVYTSGVNTFTVPAGVYTIFVQLIGGGGGGARGVASTTSVTISGTTFYHGQQAGCGGAGATVFALIRVSPGEQYDFTVGSGGAKGSSANTPGSDGGDTYMTPNGSAVKWATASGGIGGYNSFGVNPSSYGVGGYAITAAPAERKILFLGIRGANGGIATRSVDWSNQLIQYQHEANGHARIDGSSTYMGTGYGGYGESADTSGVKSSATDGGAGCALIFY